MIVAWVALAGLALAAALHAELALFTRVPRRALRVLMYHRVAERDADRATVPVPVLERHLEWLRAQGYALVSLDDVLAHVSGGAALPDRAVLLTFDDGTIDAHSLLLPLLRRLRAPAAVFVVPGLAGEERETHGRRDRFVTAAQMRELAAGGVAVGLHAFDHANLARLSPAEVEEDLRRCAGALVAGGVPYAAALAFPYGAYPRKDPAERAAFLAAVRRAGVTAAFRIGNRVNALPLASPLEIQRTEIRGDEPFWVFRWKVRTGRRRAFA